MKPIRFGVLTLLAGFAILAFSPTCNAATQNYPNKPIRYIVPWPPGGGSDTLARILATRLSEAVGQQVVIDNRAGAAGNIGAEIGAKSPPDGYTILGAYSGTHVINPSIYKNIPFKESDFAPIVLAASVPALVCVHPSLPIHNVKELIALDKANPGTLNFGSSGSGALNHLAGELFNMMTGTKLIHVPYKGGGPASIALLAGEIALIFNDPASLIQHVKAGKLRAIASTGGKRALAMPEVPTVAESGVPGYDVTSWNGILAPAAVPPEIVKRLNMELNKIITARDMRPRLIEYGFEPVGGTPEQFGQHIRAEIVKWAPVVKAAGVKVD
jgi:tripartite-type tricarboxylate transporter receptor subunit TctC